MVNAVRNRLSDVGRNARNDGEFFAYIFENNFALACVFLFQINVNFRVMNAFGVFVHLGASGSAPRRNYFRHFQEKFFGDLPDAVAFSQRSSGLRLNIYRQRSFVKFGQKRRADKRQSRNGDQKQRGRAADDEPRMTNCAAQNLLVPFFEETH